MLEHVLAGDVRVVDVQTFGAAAANPMAVPPASKAEVQGKWGS